MASNRTKPWRDLPPLDWGLICDSERIPTPTGPSGSARWVTSPLATTRCVSASARTADFEKEEPLFPFRATLPALQHAELLFGNLECTHSSLGMRRSNYHSVQMRGEPRILDALPKAGFKVVNVANNHSLQHGVDTFSDTVAMLERSGLECCGVAADRQATRSKPVIVQQNGLTIGFLGYSLRPRQYFDHLPLYAEGHPESMVLDVADLRSMTDVVIVSLHWGEEFIQEPAPHEIRLARQLVDAGATLIIGHHPHVLARNRMLRARLHCLQPGQLRVRHGLG